MACIVFVYLGLCFSVVHATQDCHGNDCPVTVNSMLQVKGQAQIFGAGWYASGEWTTCIDACTNIGLTCTEAVVENQNYEIDTSAEVLELISSVGGSTSAGGCGLMQDSWTGCPSWTATWCCYSAANRSYTGACSKAPNADGKERLCYCHEAAATNEATTTTTTPTFWPVDPRCPDAPATEFKPENNCGCNTGNHQRVADQGTCEGYAIQRGHNFYSFAVRESDGGIFCQTSYECPDNLMNNGHNNMGWKLYKKP